MRISVASVALLGAAFIGGSTVSRADVLVLDDGQIVEGDVVAAKSTEQALALRTATGDFLSVSRDKIQQVVYGSAAAVEEYLQVYRDYPNTINGNWHLAEWCKKHGLFEQRKVHLRRILEQNSDHAQARAALGHVRYRGEWMTVAERRKRQGYVWYRGRWILRQEKQILEAQQQKDLAVGQWLRKIKHWVDELYDEDPQQRDLARASLRSITDPAALQAVLLLFQDEIDDEARLLLVEILARFDTPEASRALVDLGLYDPSEEVRWAAIDYLLRRRDVDVQGGFERALNSRDNEVVRRAAFALGELGDLSATPALIDALVTRHRVVVGRQPVGSGDPLIVQPGRPVVGKGAVGLPAVAVPVPSSGGFGVGRGSDVIEMEFENTEVLIALTKLTGENFGFDQKAWGQYWAAYLHRKTANQPVLP